MKRSHLVIALGIILLGIAVLLSSISGSQPVTTDQPVASTTATSTATTTVDLPPGWAWSRQTGLSVAYPESLGTSYISSPPVDWPPQVEAKIDTFTCHPAGSETERAGATNVRTINGTQYCITTVAEGAAGSLYRFYTYVRAFEEGIVYTRFSLQFPQCMNYDEPQRSACATEQELFNVDNLADQISQTIYRR